MNRAALALLVLALLAAGCGGGGGSQPSSSGAGNAGASSPAAQSVLQAGQKTSAMHSARVSFEASFSGATSGTMTGEGVFSQRKGHLTMDLGGLSGLGSGTAELVFDKLVYYMKLPKGSDAPLPAGKEWFKLDIQKLGQQRGLDLSQLTQLNQSDPSQALDFLKGASNDFHEVGRESVRGEETTHYEGTIDLQKVAEAAPAGIQEQYRRLSELGPKSVPMEVWIGDDGLVRKISFSQKVPGGSTLTMEEELYDFGTNETVDVPSDDEVFDLTALLAQS